MYQKLLFPPKYKKIGWWILIPATILGVLLLVTQAQPGWMEWNVFAIMDEQIMGETTIFGIIKTNISVTLVGIIFIVGALFVGFSKEKNEDEFIAQTRLYALLWAVFVNYILLIIAFLFIYGLSFFSVMLYNMFTVLILFIIRFNYMLYKNSKTFAGDK